ncbi:TPA: DUF4113 domain-containing protein [Yersinia enterocolitica]|nr:DUF4113 domain-containing protein [Yersinia enterocolitica]
MMIFHTLSPLREIVINQSGKGKVWFAGQGIQKAWQMKREMLSPAYTTRFDELLIVKACE